MISQRTTARLERFSGCPALVVDGEPFLVLGAQCDLWHAIAQDKATRTFLARFQAMHASAVSVPVPWYKCEPMEGKWDFVFLVSFIESVQHHGVKLVLPLFNSNVCGKVVESPVPASDSFGQNQLYGPTYTPAYIWDAPDRFQRMVLPDGHHYSPDGPPMCPNDRRTLERERRRLVELARHLLDTDVNRTVIMFQIENRCCTSSGRACTQQMRSG